jgi:hypothetical protein
MMYEQELTASKICLHQLNLKNRQTQAQIVSLTTQVFFFSNTQAFLLLQYPSMQLPEIHNQGKISVMLECLDLHAVPLQESSKLLEKVCLPPSSSANIKIHKQQAFSCPSIVHQVT